MTQPIYTRNILILVSSVGEKYGRGHSSGDTRGFRCSHVSRVLPASRVYSKYHAMRSFRALTYVSPILEITIIFVWTVTAIAVSDSDVTQKWGESSMLKMNVFFLFFSITQACPNGRSVWVTVLCDVTAAGKVSDYHFLKLHLWTITVTVSWLREILIAELSGKNSSTPACSNEGLEQPSGHLKHTIAKLWREFVRETKIRVMQFSFVLGSLGSTDEMPWWNLWWLQVRNGLILKKITDQNIFLIEVNIF